MICKWIKSFFEKKEKVVFEPHNNLYQWSETEKTIARLINEHRNSSTLMRVKSFFRLATKELTPERACRVEAINRAVYQSMQPEITHNQMGVSAQNLEAQGLYQYGEILGYGYPTPEQVFEAWKKSESHNKMMLSSKYKFFGIKDLFFDRRHYYVVVFA